VLTWVVAGAGLAGSLAAIALPGSSNTPEIAAVLALGALALLAGHGWALPVVVTADVILLGKVWPLVVFEWPPALGVQIAAYAALLGALPGLLLLHRALPHAVDLFVGSKTSPRLRVAAMALTSVLNAVWLVQPSLL
jgi:hypothetical protein